MPAELYNIDELRLRRDGKPAKHPPPMPTRKSPPTPFVGFLGRPSPKQHAAEDVRAHVARAADLVGALKIIVGEIAEHEQSREAAIEIVEGVLKTLKGA